MTDPKRRITILPIRIRQDGRGPEKMVVGMAFSGGVTAPLLAVSLCVVSSAQANRTNKHIAFENPAELTEDDARGVS